jgi:multidrug resistance efflux pump
MEVDGANDDGQQPEASTSTAKPATAKERKRVELASATKAKKERKLKQEGKFKQTKAELSSKKVRSPRPSA